jgi:hypothetical protein
MGRWLIRLFLLLAAATVVTFAVDTGVYWLRGEPTSTVMVRRFMNIPLKGQKEEYDYLGRGQAPCAVALFPHKGLDPCWQLRRYPDQWENL